MSVAADRRHVALVEPPGAGDVHSRRGLLRIPRSLFRPPGPPPRADEYDVAGTRFDTRLFLPCVEVRRVDRRRRLEVFHSFQACDVDQDTSRDQSILIRGYGLLIRSSLV